MPDLPRGEPLHPTPPPEPADPAEATVVPPCEDTAKFEAVLQLCYDRAIALYDAGDCDAFAESIPDDLGEHVAELAALQHAARGALLTLVVYKAIQPAQDIRACKIEHPGGFSARSWDTRCTIPFLAKHDLKRSVESHWLSQTLSLGDQPWTRERTFTTSPRKIGPLLLECVNTLEEQSALLDAESASLRAQECAVVVLCQLINARNRDRVLLTRPKNLTISQVLSLLDSHFAAGYQAGTPRLPQVAMYAIYECLLNNVRRYGDKELEPLGRMKAADRKSGAVGDVELSASGRPIEAVETKFGIPITVAMIRAAIEKIKTASVERYFILSTAGIAAQDEEEIAELCRRFRSSNGCEIIVNGVLPTIGYYLRLLFSVNDFLERYIRLVEDDVDLGYEHRVRWNELCEAYT